jgi:hypothetical protein
MYLWKDTGSDVRPALETRVDHQVLNGYSVNRHGLLGITILIPHHIIENSAHVLLQQILVIVL